MRMPPVFYNSIHGPLAVSGNRRIARKILDGIAGLNRNCLNVKQWIVIRLDCGNHAKINVLGKVVVQDIM